MASSTGILQDWKQKGALCWIEREVGSDPSSGGSFPRVFEEGTIYQEVSKKIIRVNVEEYEEEIQNEKVFQRSDVKQDGIDDMVDLRILNDAELITNLEKRYSSGRIHTYVGPTLLVVNPFREIEGLSTDEKLKQYYQDLIETQKTAGALSLKQVQPHVFAIAAESYKSLFEMDQKQAIVISGESGAGKTENAKLCMKFLATTAQLIQQKSNSQLFRTKLKKQQTFQASQLNSPTSSKIHQQSIEDKILSCNPILESFGNAKTAKNDNSSRFGKYVTLLVDMKENKITGSKITNYLLEKVRIIQQGKDERNFHIFYFLLYGADKKILNSLQLEKGGESLNANNFEYLKSVVAPNSQNFPHLLQEVTFSLDLLGLSEFQSTIFQILAAILHLGNVKFDDSTQDENHPCTVKNRQQLQIVSDLLGIEPKELEKEITSKYQIVSGVGYPKYYNLDTCNNQRDSMSKELYDQLFNWLVRELNSSLSSDMQNKEQLKTIGLLDIYGFEVFSKNGFEQFFINYTNERLQQLYIQYVFKAEEVTFKDEGLLQYFKKLDFKDNQDVIDILDNQVEPLGIFKLLEDRCKNPAASLDQNLLNDIRKKHGDKDKLAKIPFPKFRNPKKINDPTFIIIHSARDVEYEIKGFIEKNKDEVNIGILKAISKSKVPLLNKIVSERDDISDHVSKRLMGGKETPTGNRFRQISQKFISEVSALMSELIACNVQFIRCVKPNEEKIPLMLNQKFALNQIRYLGVLESINVRKQSYPIRQSYLQFYRRIFGTFFSHLGEDQVLMGKTKIFFKTYEVITEISGIYAKKTERMQKAAIKLQNKFWQYNQLKKFRKFLKGVRSLQRKWRIFSEHLKAAQTVQVYMRTRNAIIQHQKTKKSIIFIQRQWRAAIKRLKEVTFKRIKRSYVVERSLCIAWEFITNRASITITRMLKGCYIRGKYPEEVQQIRTLAERMKQNRACIKIQRLHRGNMIRRRIKVLNAAAFKIQGYFKMKWLRALFVKLKKATKIIQRNVRSFLIRKKEREKRNYEFLGPLIQNLNRIRISEELHLFNGQSNVIDTLNPLPPEIVQHFRADRSVEIILEKSHEHFFQSKIYLFSYIIDFEILSDTSEIYDPLWSSLYQASFRDSYEKQAYIQHLSVGDTHSLSCTLSSKVHTWGWNDQGQLGVPIVEDSNEGNFNALSGTQIFSMNIPSQIQRITQISAGSNHNLLLDHKGCIWSWGSNNKGQLGLNHYENSETPIKIQCGKNEFTKIEAKGNENFAVTKDGRLFHWPTRGNQGECVNFPIEIILPKVQIKDVSCGHNFSILLTTHGLLYSLGTENKEGELGLGDRLPRKIPTLLTSLKDAGEKIIQIDCGFKHAICKTSLGKVYTWGWGERGQLGHGEFGNELYPRFLRNAKLGSDKCLQVVAGHKCCFILVESRKIFQFGTNSMLDHKPDLSEFNIKLRSDKLNQGFYEPVRIQATWGKTLSLVYVTYGNTRKTFEKNVVLKSKILNNMISKWSESNIDTIDPPFIEKIANFISEKNMKMPMCRVPNVQFESRKQYERLKNELLEANYMQQIEQEYQTAQLGEKNQMYQNYNAQELDTNIISDGVISPQKDKELKDVYGADWRKENWEEFQQLELAVSITDSQVGKQDQQYFAKQDAKLKQKQLLEQQEKEQQEQQQIYYENLLKQQQLQQQVQQSHSDNDNKKLEQSRLNQRHGANSSNRENLKESNSYSSSSGKASQTSFLQNSQNSKNQKKYDLQVPSTSKKSNAPYNSKSPQGQMNINKFEDSLDDSSMSQDRENKLKVIKDKIEQLAKIPQSKWTEIDREFMKGAQELNISSFDLESQSSRDKFKKVPSKSPEQQQQQLHFHQSEKDKAFRSRQDQQKSDNNNQSNNVNSNSHSSKQISNQQKNNDMDPLLTSVRAKWQSIVKTPKSEWTASDKEFMIVVQNNNLEKLFQNLP